MYTRNILMIEIKKVNKKIWTRKSSLLTTKKKKKKKKKEKKNIKSVLWYLFIFNCQLFYYVFNFIKKINKKKIFNNILN